MRLTIVPEDGFVIVNGLGYKVDCSSIDDTIHAVQWYDTYGDIEFKVIDGERSPNQRITDMTDFLTVLNLWNAAHVEASKPPPKPKTNKSLLDDYDLGPTIADKLSTPTGA